MDKFDTPVLIVGGGPIGLATALDLGRRGTASILIEQDHCTAPVLLAKAGTLNERSMELCRHWCLVEKIASFGFPDHLPRDTIYCTSLTGHFIGRDPMAAARDRAPPKEGPEMLRRCPQHVFDPILAEAARETGLADIRYSTRFDDLAPDDDGVTVTVTDLASDRRYDIRAQYVVACDGAGSRARRRLGIPFEGKDLGNSVSTMLRIPALEPYHGMGVGERYMFIGPEGTWANMTSVDGRELWRFTIIKSASREELAEEEIHAAVRRAFGDADVPYTIERVMPWRRSQCTAARFREGRVVLAGDAAHTTSPTGGHGLNTGLGDAFELGWMLNALIDGWGGDGLLDAYDLERRPVAIRNSTSSTVNFGAWVGNDGYAKVMDDTPEGEAARKAVGERLSQALYPEWHSQGIGMGFRYENSPIVVPDGTPPTPDEISVYLQTARPGHRAPHAWLEAGVSTLDLFCDGFVLLCLGDGPPDPAPLVAAARARGLPLKAVALSNPDVVALYERALVLVRPDGQVAWRADELPEDPLTLVDMVRGAAPSATDSTIPAALKGKVDERPGILGQ